MVALRTKEQQHVFNMPFQLGSEGTDQPHHADLYRLTLLPVPPGPPSAPDPLG